MSKFASSVAYSSDSAGMHPSHTLPLKLRAIAEAGFPQVEIGFPDLESYAEQEYKGDYQKLNDKGEGDEGKLAETALKVKKLCDELGLSVLVVHPFSKFEGYEDPEKRAGNLRRAKVWLGILKILGCTMLQVGSSDDPSSSADRDVIARDLRELADLAAKQDPPIRIAYEMWAWGVHINTWEDIWDICKRVDRSNFGLCLDTFQICARAYADPTSPDGLLPNPKETLDASLKSLAKTIPADRIFYFQISDGSKNIAAEKLKEEAKKEKIDPLYAWSNAWRPLPFMDDVVEDLDQKLEGKPFGGYLPVVEVIQAVLETGWRGPWSLEVFYQGSMGREDADVSRLWARAGMKCLKCIDERLSGGNNL